MAYVFLTHTHFPSGATYTKHEWLKVDIAKINPLAIKKTAATEVKWQIRDWPIHIITKVPVRCRLVAAGQRSNQHLENFTSLDLFLLSTRIYRGLG